MGGQAPEPTADANLAAACAAVLAGTVPIAAYGTGGPLTAADMRWFFGLLAPGVPRTEPRLCSPARTGPAGAAPAHLVTAEHDVLRDEGEAYGRKLEAAGVPTIRRRDHGLPHGLIRLHNLVDTADAALGDVAIARARGQGEEPT